LNAREFILLASEIIDAEDVTDLQTEKGHKTFRSMERLGGQERSCFCKETGVKMREQYKTSESSGAMKISDKFAEERGIVLSNKKRGLRKGQREVVSVALIPGGGRLKAYLEWRKEVIAKSRHPVSGVC